MRLPPGQLRLFETLDEREPGGCPHEAGTFGLKSKCMLTGRPVWANCRERGHCVRGAAPSDDLEEDDEQGLQVR